MPNPDAVPPLDLDALEARYQDWRRDQDGPSALHWDELVATEELCNAVPALVARVRALEVERAEHTELLKWLGHMIGTLAWWESDDSRACIPCDGCRIEGREMAEALAPWRDQFVRELHSDT